MTSLSQLSSFRTVSPKNISQISQMTNPTRRPSTPLSLPEVQALSEPEKSEFSDDEHEELEEEEEEVDELIEHQELVDDDDVQVPSSSSPAQTPITPTPHCNTSASHYSAVGIGIDNDQGVWMRSPSTPSRPRRKQIQIRTAPVIPCYTDSGSSIARSSLAPFRIIGDRQPLFETVSDEDCPSSYTISSANNRLKSSSNDIFAKSTSTGSSSTQKVPPQTPRSRIQTDTGTEQVRVIDLTLSDDCDDLVDSSVQRKTRSERDLTLRTLPSVHSRSVGAGDRAENAIDLDSYLEQLEHENTSTTSSFTDVCSSQKPSDVYEQSRCESVVALTSEEYQASQLGAHERLYERTTPNALSPSLHKTESSLAPIASDHESSERDEIHEDVWPQRFHLRLLYRQDKRSDPLTSRFVCACCDSDNRKLFPTPQKFRSSPAPSVTSFVQVEGRDFESKMIQHAWDKHRQCNMYKNIVHMSKEEVGRSVNEIRRQKQQTQKARKMNAVAAVSGDLREPSFELEKTS
ncbi:hypothetical protein F5878DRAFT_696866 [Lentinula raphanica]|uniref:Uncharacterized protein n=1 Tax=Lentinula raphanica TaxID=153919 RepID=A0AA38PGZ9_9AGAR|nr:hypothetical protein F5878DRAFT_696866 [Lentinula raphanica]